MKSTVVSFLAVAVLISSGCSRNDESFASGSLREYVLTASFEDTGGTKTTLVDGGTTCFWEAEDSIKVFFAGSQGCFVSTNTELTYVTTFKGKLTSFIGGDEKFSGPTQLWAVYPYREDAEFVGGDYGSVVTSLPNFQTGRAGTFGRNSNVVMAEPASVQSGVNNILKFYNVCSGVRFTLTRSDIKSVTFEGLNGENLAGEFKMAFEGGVPVVKEVINGEKKVKLVAPDNGTFEAGKWYYIVALPTHLESGFKMTFTTESHYAELVRKDKVYEMLRGTYGQLSNADDGLTFKEKDYIDFEDVIFEKYCLDNFDTDRDGKISMAEAAAVKKIVCSGMGISSLKGVEFFTALETLNCWGNKITTLDVSKLTDLKTLNCWHNQLTVLDVSHNPMLYSLSCYYNHIKMLNFGEITSLNKIYCQQNMICVLDVSKCTDLSVLDCSCNRISDFDVSHNTKLENLYCASNGIKSLDISGLTELFTLDCSGNQIGELDVSHNTKLISLGCEQCSISSLDITGLTELKNLYCSSNGIKTLDISSLTELSDLCCNGNQIAELDVSHNTKLATLQCGGNDITKLDLTNNRELGALLCTSTLLDTIIAGSNLSKLFCSDNQHLKYLDVSASHNMNELSCVDCPSLTEIWLSKSQSISVFRHDEGVTISRREDKPVTPVAVDLGLSVNWATFNVGATDPAEYGGHYAWGELENKWYYSWSSYKFGNGSETVLHLTKYNTDSLYGTVDNKTMLEMDDDVAHSKWGGSWRIPTVEEWQELLDECTWTLTSESGIEGYEVTSGKSGYEGKKIFLPKAGYNTNNACNFNIGTYWTSALNIYVPFNSECCCFVGSEPPCLSDFYSRSYGLSVRPVCE